MWVHGASPRASPIPTLVHQAGKMSLLPRASEEDLPPEGAQVLGTGMSPHDGFSPWSMLLGASSSPPSFSSSLCLGSWNHDQSPCSPTVCGDAEIQQLGCGSAQMSSSVTRQ